ncbi:hypothetical protein [Nitrincola sp. A-D6]|uniref:hypothetical protein n=1 Tax=Nitrincola sp. A-D6 TaxID=1545442 RepID=UPI0011869EF7|nr:hypothetical protein [Nitrincola sp. A-D6]
MLAKEEESIHAFRRPGRSAVALTAMDGGNAENAGAFFGHGARRSHQSDTPTPPKVLCQSNYRLEQCRQYGYDVDR